MTDLDLTVIPCEEKNGSPHQTSPSQQMEPASASPEGKDSKLRAPDKPIPVVRLHSSGAAPPQIPLRNSKENNARSGETQLPPDASPVSTQPPSRPISRKPDSSSVIASQDPAKGTLNSSPSPGLAPVGGRGVPLGRGAPAGVRQAPPGRGSPIPRDSASPRGTLPSRSGRIAMGARVGLTRPAGPPPALPE